MKLTLNTPIQELYQLGIISTRTFNCLKSVHMDTLGMILNHIETSSDLMKIPKFGQKSLFEIEAVLNKIIAANSRHLLDIPKEFSILGESLTQIITKAYIAVTEGDTDVNIYLQTTYPHPYFMHKLVMGNLNNMLKIVDGYSREKNIEIRHSYQLFIDLVLKGMEESRIAGDMIHYEYNQKKKNLSSQIRNFTYEQIVTFFLTPIAKDCLENIYQKMLSTKVSVRTKNFAAKEFPHFFDLIKYADASFSAYRNICPNRYNFKTLTELFQFNQLFKKEFDRVSNLSSDDLQIECLKLHYPYLTNSQHQFIHHFIKTYQHEPLLFLMLHYFRHSKKRTHKIYSLMHGIFDGKCRTLQEIADIMGITRERVRQIVCCINIQECDLIHHQDWEYYRDLFKLPFLYEKEDNYIQLKETEFLYVNFDVFASLISLVANFEIKKIEGHIILVNSQIREIPINEYISKLKSIANAKYSNNTYISIDSILDNIPHQFKLSLKKVLIYISTEIYKINVTNGQLYLPQTYIDISDELYDILLQANKPMHIDAIFHEFKIRYPDHKYIDSIQIKPFLYRQKHIKSIGKTACYALDIWEGIYFGSIRDLLVDLLEMSETPVHIDILYNKVIEYYPNTTKASITSTMKDGNIQKFIEFEGNYFGLTSKQYPTKYNMAQSIRRFTFERRLQMFKNFVETHHRFPNYNGCEQEQSLIRWYNHIINGDIIITEEQRKLLNTTLNMYDVFTYPRSSIEYDFLINCQKVKDYIQQYRTLPTRGNAPKLYAWLYRSRNNYIKYKDTRYQHMMNLLNYISSLGFKI